jgi:SAM-dependent methyltransferase
MNMEQKVVVHPRQQFRFLRAMDCLRATGRTFENYLEIGAGLGAFSQVVRPYVKNMTLLDFSEEAAAALKERFQGNAKVLSADFMEQPFSQKYDLVVTFEVLEHIQNDMAFLEKIHSLLNDDGVLLFSVPAHMSRWSVTDEITGHYRRYARSDIQKLLQRSGLRVDQCISYGFPLLNIVALFRNVFFAHRYSHLLKTFKDSSKESLSKQSGLGYLQDTLVGRLIKNCTKLLFNEHLTRVYICLFSSFERLDLGDGYLCLARKCH